MAEDYRDSSLLYKKTSVSRAYQGSQMSRNISYLQMKMFKLVLDNLQEPHQWLHPERAKHSLPLVWVVLLCSEKVGMLPRPLFFEESD